jgi:hypothetical protein
LFDFPKETQKRHPADETPASAGNKHGQNDE